MLCGRTGDGRLAELLRPLACVPLLCGVRRGVAAGASWAVMQRVGSHAQVPLSTTMNIYRLISIHIYIHIDVNIRVFIHMYEYIYIYIRI